MRQIILDVEESKYAQLIQYLQTLGYVRVHTPKKSKNGSKKLKKQYDFSDLSGKLEWAGNAVTEQRRLRDEW